MPSEPAEMFFSTDLRLTATCVRMALPVWWQQCDGFEALNACRPVCERGAGASVFLSRVALAAIPERRKCIGKMPMTAPRSG